MTDTGAAGTLRRGTPYLFETLLDSALIGLTFLDHDLRYVEINRALAEQIGLDRSRIIGRQVREVVPDLADHLEPILRNVLRSGRPLVDQEVTGRTWVDPGVERHWVVSYYPHRSSDGRILGVGVVVVEDTEVRTAKRELERRAHEQAVVAELGRRALIESEVDAFLGETVRVVARTLDVETVKVLELLPDRTELLLRAGVGWHEGLVGSARVPTGTESQAGYTLLGSAPVVVEDFATERRFVAPPLLVEHGIVSGMSVMIGPVEGPFGILGVHDRRPRTFEKHSVDFLRAVANVLAAGIERSRIEEELRESLRLLERTGAQRRDLLGRLVSAQEDERRHVARELHDDLGQVLTSIALFAQDLEQDMTGEMAERTAALRLRVEGAVRRMRQLVWRLRPPELDHQGLVAAVLRLVEETREQLGIPIDMQTTLGERRLPRAVETAVYRIVQEALTNAARHAAAGSISIVMIRDPRKLTVVIEDDGRAFEPEDAAPGAHLGLIGMRERAEQLGGTVTIDAAPGRGTAVQVSLPLEDPPEGG